jgi:hypothetical protein
VVRTKADIDLLLEKHGVLSRARMASEVAYTDLLAARVKYQDASEALTLAANELEKVYKEIEKRDGK